MKDTIKFKINENLDKVFAERTRDIDSGLFVFIYNPLKMDIKKAFKLIAVTIEDKWAALSLSLEKNKDYEQIVVDAKRRIKQTFVFPNDDQHFNRKKDRYQYHTYLAALQFVKKFNTAIDVGGHIGFYSSAMLDTFKNVIAFEPSPTNFKCFEKNASKATVYQVGLGDVNKEVDLFIAEDNSGNNSIVENFGEGKVTIQVKTLDSFNFKNIDLIKIDVQGYEEQVLLGAKETISKNKPIVIAELITHKDSPPNKAALDIMSGYGYKVLMIMGKDYVFGPH
jgi:FkbM family methyltransferase